MIVERTKDKSIISKILNDDDIFNAIAEDGCKKGEFDPDVDGEIWVSVVHGELMGVCNFHAINKITIQGHIHILKKHRKHSLLAANSIYRWLLDNSGFLKLNVEIPSCHINVMKYCKAIGFSLEGLNRLSYLKGGKVLDQVLLGITRSEIEDFLK